MISGVVQQLSRLSVLPLVSGMRCIGGFEWQMSHGSLAPLTWCGLPPALVGSQFLDESQMRWSSSGSGTEACHARSSTKVGENCLESSISGPSSTRQAPVERESLPEICNPMPRPKVASCLKSVPTKAGHRLCRSQHGGVWTTAPPIALAGRSLDVPRRKNGGVALGSKTCKDPCRETE